MYISSSCREDSHGEYRERNQVFDLNDFDKTLPGPWEWDVKRLAASIVIAGWKNGFPCQDKSGSCSQLVFTVA